jgi:hypothetical protein
MNYCAAALGSVFPYGFPYYNRRKNVQQSHINLFPAAQNYVKSQEFLPLHIQTLFIFS